MKPALYRTLAEKVADQIKSGSYKSGERLPSIRTFAQKHQISVSTAVNTYAHLEDRRLIKAYPKSGYVVNSQVTLDVPSESKPSCKPTKGKQSALLFEIVEQSTSSDIKINFGAALPNLDFPAITELHNILAKNARKPSRLKSLYLGGASGYEPLRRQIAKRSIDSGNTLSPDQIIITNGCQEAIRLSLQAIAQPSDTIITESPSFYGTLQTIELLGMKVLEIPTSPQTGIQLDALEFALEKWEVAACVLTPSFHNPLGYCMPEDNKKRLLSILSNYEIPLIEDDIYGELSYDNRPRSIQSYDKNGQVILCSSFSKSLDPGIRLGWVSPGKYKLRVKEQKLAANISNPAIAQIAMAEYLEKSAYDRHLRRARSYYRQQKLITLDLLNHYFSSDIKVTNPDGGTLLWIELPKQVDAMKLYQKALKKGISIAPGPLFTTSKKCNHYIRLNFGFINESVIEKGIESLSKCLN